MDNRGSERTQLTSHKILVYNSFYCKGIYKCAKKNILFVYYANPLGLLTIQDNVKSFQLLSKNNITLLNTYPNVKISKEIDLRNFDGILIDSTLAYFAQTLDALDENISIKLKEYDGVKILLKQDEHIHSHETARIIGQKKIDLVFTCLDESQIFRVYPRNLVGEAQFVRQLTGYFSDPLIKLASSMEYTRCIDLSYRGSIQPLQCGRLGYEKWNIGNSVSHKLFGKQIKTDISSRWVDRIHGKDWIKFLSCSKAVLGVESGSNLFDFIGEVEKQCLHFTKQNYKLQNDPDKFYNKAHAEFLFQYENNVKYAQISPRHFEAAATRTLQVLYDGEYSNIFFPYKHYLPLRRDLSNLEEIKEILFNSSKRRQITECAYEEIVMNEKFHYKSKVAQFDFLVEKISTEKNLKPRVLNNNIIKHKKNIIILVPHEAHLDPRITWLKKGFDDFATVTVIGTTTCAEKNIKWQIRNENTVEANLNYAGLTKLVEEYEKNIYSDYYDLKRLLNSFCIEDKSIFPKSSFYSNESIDRHRWYCHFFNKTDRALRFTADQIIDSNNMPPDLLVCCDLSSLLPGIILAQRHKIPLFYDAHEFWAYSDVNYLPWEVDFWLYYERSLLKYVTFPVTVSKSLAEKMSALYTTDFNYIPNVETIKNHFNIEKGKFKVDLLFDDCNELLNFENNASVNFLYMGAYAPGRGLEQLIDNWINVGENNKLILRGVYWQYTDLLIERAKKNGLYNKTIFFFKPVKEFELISMASAFDVGIIPYDQNINAAYQYCCPNKLSQYMAAGLPILSNQLIEVERVVSDAHCGFIVNFNLEQAFVDIINKFRDVNLRKKMGEAAQNYFVNNYNWEKQAKPLNEKLKKLMAERINTPSFPINILKLPDASDALITSETLSISKISHTFRISPFHKLAYILYSLLKALIPRKIKGFLTSF